MGSNATQSFTLTVAPGTAPPTIISASSATFVLGTSGSFTVMTTGMPTPTLSISGALPTGVTFTAATGVFSGTAAAGTTGSYPITITAQNGIVPNATQNFTLIVGQAPAITSASNATFTVGTAGTFTVTATGTPAPTFSETGALPTGVTLTAATGVLAGTPAAGTGGTYPITVTANNGLGSNATQSFTLTVNQAPAITSVNNATFAIGTAGSFTVTATGTPGATLSESGGLPTGVTFTPATGVLAGTPAVGTVGIYPITLTAANGVGSNATQSFTLTVNQAPTITSANNTTFAVGTAGTFTVTATGTPAPTFSETGALPTGVTLTAATGVLAGTPAAGTGGTYPITVTANNGVGSNATQSFTLTVNQAPAITSASSVSFAISLAGTFTVTATGNPTATLSESGTLPTGVTFTPSTGVLAGTPAAGTNGTYPITFAASNGVGTNASQNFTLTVSQAPVTPAITSVSSATFTAGAAGTFTVTATGTPAPTLSETGALPSGVTFVPATGVLSGTPGAGTGGTYPITFTAANGVGSNATQSFTLTVNQAPAITSAAGTTFIVGTAGAFTFTSTGTPKPTLSEAGALPAGVTFTAATGVLSGTPVSGSGAIYSITITAANGVGSNATQSFTLTVNQAPAITSSNVTGFTTGSTGTFTVTAIGSPKPTLSESGALPSGVSFTAATGVLSGTPASGTAGNYPLIFTAANGVGSNATQTFTLAVSQNGCTPVIAPSGTYVNDPTLATFNASSNLTRTLNTTLSPACTTTAATYIETTAAGQHAATESYTGSIPNGTAITDTLYVGNVSGSRYLDIGIFDQSWSHYGVILGINPSTCATSQKTSTDTGTNHWTLPTTPLKLTAFNVGGVAWCQIQLSVIPQSSATGLNVYINYDTSSTGGGNSYTGDGTSGMKFWGETILPVAAPAVTSVGNATFTEGIAGTFSVTATGTPTPTLSESGTLPSGVTFTAATGVLGGTPAIGSSGTYPITITAANGVGSNATQSFTLTVVPGTAPALITSASSTTFFTSLAGSFTVTTTGTPTPTLSESGALPSGVTFTPASGVLAGTPAAGTNGTYPITITAANGIGSNATQSFTLTVNLSQVPAITSANNTTFVIGTAGTFAVTATGTPAPTLSVSGSLPTGVTFTPATGSLAGTPVAGTGGNYPITITAANGVGSNATQTFTLTVNQAPAITSASNATFVIGTAGTFTVMATGLPVPTLSESGLLPAGVTFTPATGVLAGTPAAGTSGSYPIAITAANGVGTNATQNFTLTVNEVPAITSSNNTTFTVGAPGTFAVTATGTPPPTLSITGTLPTGVTFTPATGALAGTPAAGTGGTFPVTITAQNGVSPAATQAFTITVNQAPTITSINNATFVLGTAGTFTVIATGFPAPTLSETGTLPTGMTFTPATGVLAGTPAAGTSGSYPITITAANGVGTNATQSFTLTVNQLPAITSANNTTFTAGTSGQFTVAATGTPAPTFTETGALPTGVTFAATGILAGTPGAGTGGIYAITITAQNGVLPNATQSFTLTVNQAPTITSASSTTFTVATDGTFAVTATGMPVPTLSEVGALPAGVTLTSAGILAGTPAAGTGGIYPFTITAQNGVGANATQSFTLTVKQSPAITSANSTTFTVGTAGTFTVTATGTPASTFTETGALPTGVTLAATGILAGTPAAGTGGIYPITITAQNGVGTNASQSFTLTVNQAPAITSAINTVFALGAAGTFTVTATGTPAPTLSATGTLPAGVTFTPATGVLAGTPAAGTVGTYPITFTAQNGVGANATQSFTLTVNQPPTITSAGTTTFTVGTAGSFTVTATGTPAPTFSETGTLPAGVTFTAATGILAGTPAASTGGTYPVTITAQNGVLPKATQNFTLTVAQAPGVSSANNTAFTVGTAGTFTVTATGYPAPTLSESGTLPSGVTFTAATGILAGTPAAGTAGSYPITITASNGVGTNATQSFTLTVKQAPAITSANNTSFTVGTAGTFTVTATGTPVPTLSEVGTLPSGVTFTAATGVLAGTPAAGTGGTYSITITAANGVGSNATQNFTLSVKQAPTLVSANKVTFTVGFTSSFTVSATGTPQPTLSETGSLPSGVTFNASTGVLSGTPASGTAGTYSITFKASNGVGTNATQSFTLTVNPGSGGVPTYVQSAWEDLNPAVFSSTTTAGDTYVYQVSVDYGSGGRFTGNPVDTEGNTCWTKILDMVTPDNKLEQAVYMCVGVKGGTLDSILPSLNGSYDQDAVFYELRNVYYVDQTAQQANSNTGAVTSPSITTTQASEVLLVLGSSSPLPPISGFVQTEQSGFAQGAIGSQYSGYEVVSSIQTGVRATATVNSGGNPDSIMGIASFASSPTSPVGPTIVTQPSNQSVQVGQTATFNVSATGTAPLSYQWNKNGSPISGATSPSYTTPATAITDNGAQFTVMVSNSVNTVLSNPATLTVSQGSGCTPVTPPSGKYFTDFTFSNFNVSSNLTRTLNASQSPACTTTAATYIETTANGQFAASETYNGSIPNGVAITGTFYVAPVSGSRYLDVAIFDQSFSHYAAILGINTSTCSTSQSPYTDGNWTLPGTPLTLTQVTVGGVVWCQVQLSAVPQSSASGLTFYFDFDTSNNGSGETHTGDGSSGMEFWGAGI